MCAMRGEWSCNERGSYTTSDRAQQLVDPHPITAGPSGSEGSSALLLARNCCMLPRRGRRLRQAS